MKAKTRTNVSWRISKMNEQDKLNKWCNAQSNIEQSLTNLVLHMIDMIGYKDIRDFETQQELYKLKMGITGSMTSEKLDESKESDQIIDNSSVVDEPTSEEVKKDPLDDIFDNLDPKNVFWKED
ncbi:hypothetical protein ACO0DA_10455 [Bacillus subtilis]|uniref:hypothetical protein n=1 Tax=Bacillus subtilis TaxID=1423 RepID=UPI00100A0386|nr:hypothetical protein [Bacillus subtilis]MEC0400840.1 hypothetical protein [Bacillus subtilis]QAW06689.1 hypothetical protein ES968_22275 [Bacillus subtilis]